MALDQADDEGGGRDHHAGQRPGRPDLHRTHVVRDPRDHDAGDARTWLAGPPHRLEGHQAAQQEGAAPENDEEGQDEDGGGDRVGRLHVDVGVVQRERQRQVDRHEGGRSHQRDPLAAYQPGLHQWTRDLVQGQVELACGVVDDAQLTSGRLSRHKWKPMTAQNTASRIVKKSHMAPAVLTL